MKWKQPTSATPPAKSRGQLAEKLEQVFKRDESGPQNLRELATDTAPRRRLPGPPALDPGDFDDVPDAATAIVRRLQALSVVNVDEVEARVAGGGSVLLPDVEAVIIAAIQLGAYKWVACACAGISATTLAKWERDERPMFREFAARLEAAYAQARARAEVRVAHGRPESWLMRGPGKDRGVGMPGWSDSSSKVEVTGRVAHAHLHGGRVEVEHSEQPKTVDRSKLSLAELRAFERLGSKLLGEKSIADPIEIDPLA